MTEGNPPSLADELPEPEDDGGADHLVGAPVPAVALPATNGPPVDLSSIAGRAVVYCFPKMGRTADDPDPDGWEAIPGAYGCTEESCSFRDHYRELTDRGRPPAPRAPETSFDRPNGRPNPGAEGVSQRGYSR